MSDLILNAFQNVFELRMLLYMVAGLAIGVLAGAMPGLNGGIAIALLLPLTYSMTPIGSLVLLTSVYTGGCFGGAITAILINVPGSPAAIATVFDGYPLACKKSPSWALGISLGASVMGGLFSMFVLILIIQPLASFALHFGPPETFLLVIFALTCIASLSSESMVKGLIAGLLGVLIGTIGFTASGNMRFTFGSIYLMDGVPVITALIGFLAISEILIRIQKDDLSEGIASTNTKWTQILGGCRFVLTRPLVLLRSSMIGVFVGAIPGVGGTIGSIISYDTARRLAKPKQRFGKGEPDGVIAAESANNASEGGALATMLAIGVPGGTATAILFGALTLHGMVPGPRFIFEHTGVVYSLLVSTVFQQVMLLVVGLLTAIFFAKLIFLPFRFLVPAISILCYLGAYSIRNAGFDAGLLFGFGALGWIMRSQGYPAVATVIGIILGPIADAELIRTGQLYKGWDVFITRPVCILLTVLIVANLSLPIVRTLVRRWPLNRS